MGLAGKDRTFEVLKSEVRATPLCYGDSLDFVFTLDVRRPHLCRGLDTHVYWVRTGMDTP